MDVFAKAFADARPLLPGLTVPYRSVYYITLAKSDPGVADASQHFCFYENTRDCFAASVCSDNAEMVTYRQGNTVGHHCLECGHKIPIWCLAHIVRRRFQSKKAQHVHARQRIADHQCPVLLTKGFLSSH